MKKLLAIAAAAAAVFISGCAHDNELARARADATVAQANARVAEAQAAAEEAKAVQALATKVDAGGATAYLLTKGLKGLALGGGGQQQAVAAPAQPQSVLGLAWQTALQVADIALRGYGIRANRDVSVIQSNNNRDIALSSNATFATLGQSIATAGAAGYPYVQAPQPNITQTLSGTGVLGSGTYTGPVTTTTTRNCNGGNAASGGAGGSGSAGTTTTPGSAGGNAGSGGSAPGGSC